jgi:hypothetical protein
VKSWLALTLAAASILYVLALDNSLDLNGDSPRFVMLARSIHNGESYEGRFDVVDHPETQIPYLYPMLLSAVVAVAGPEAYLGFKAVSVVSMLLALWAMWFWMSQWTTESDARSIVLVAAFLAQSQLIGVHIATEAAYLAASFACLGFMEKLVRTPSARVYWLLTVPLIGISFHLRAAGWSLLATFVITLWLKQTWRHALLGGALGMIACAPWLLRLFRFGLGYAAEFEQNSSGVFAVLYRIGYNVAANIAKSLPDLLVYPFMSPFLPYERMFFVKAAIGFALAALILAGLSRYFRGRKVIAMMSSTEVYVLIYAIGALSWTVHGERYLLPILPILIWCLFSGAGRWRSALMYALIVIGIAGCLINVYSIRSGIRKPEEAGYIQAVQWLKGNAGPTDRVMSRYPTWVAAANGNRGIRWDETNDPEIQQRSLTTNGIQWVIVDHNKVLRETAIERLTPLIHQHPEHFQLQFATRQSDPTRVYRFVP